MKKLIVACAAALLAAPAAWGQGYLPRPITNPFDRAPGGYFFGGGVPLSPYGYGYGPSPYGVPGTPFLQGDPASVQVLRLLQQQQALRGGADPSSPYPTTGHPTSFFNYSRYFFNQGGSTGVVALPGPGLAVVEAFQAGTAPTRPATGAKPPSRGGGR
jgi:hypothetical protein